MHLSYINPKCVFMKKKNRDIFSILYSYNILIYSQKQT